LITQGQKREADNPFGVGALSIAVISFVLFVIVESRVARPMFDFKAFRVRNFSGALLGACGMNFSFWPFVIYFPIYLQAVLGYSSVGAGLTVLAYTLPTIVVPPVAERLLLKRGRSEERREGKGGGGGGGGGGEEQSGVRKDGV